MNYKTLLLCALIICLASSTADARDELPAPWNRVRSLNAVQKARIKDIAAATQREIEQARKRIKVERTEIHRRSGTLPLAKMDIVLWTKSMIRLRKFTERDSIFQLLTPEQRAEATQAWAGYVQTVEIENFESFAAKQQNDYFCWAASLQMLFNYAGVNWDQEQIADEIKGNSDAQTASPQEISKGASGWRFNLKDPGKNWSADVQYHTGVPPGVMVIAHIEFNTFVFVELGERHVAVLHKVTYRDTTPESTVETAFIYDPLTGQDIELKWADAAKQITGWWSARAEYSATRVF